MSKPTGPPELHEHRDVASSFGTDAARYDRARPRYPDELVQRIVAVSPGPDVLDVGCGTGIAARQFQAAGCRVLGVDVDPRMGALARQFGIEVEMAPFESWDAAGRKFDAVIAAQAWHWVDPVAGAQKVAEVLHPGGRFAAFWNVFQPPADLAAAFSEVYRRLVPDSIVARPAPASPAAGYAVLSGKAAEGLQASGGFGQTEEWRFEWDRDYRRDEWLDLAPTMGDASQWPAATLDEVLAGLGAVIDAAGGSFRVHFSVIVATAARTA
jgi:SAM-dependent methyltransferase